jgi:DNA repair ATPase RecN
MNNDLKYILSVNEKSIELNLEVSKQNETVIELLEELDNKLDNIEKSNFVICDLLKDDNNHDHNTIINFVKSIDENMKELNCSIKELKEMKSSVVSIENELKGKIVDIDRNLFRLMIVMGSTGVGLIVSIVQGFLHK